MKFSEINAGDKAEVIHTITDTDIEKFVDLTGDDNKLHINREFASKTDFKVPVVHGMLGASFISTLIGTKLPGDGALWFSQTLEFLRPVRVGDTITVEAIVISKNEKQQAIELKTDIYNQHKQIVTSGIAKVKIIEQISEVNDTASIQKEREKVALILGATGGIGSATAKRLADDGYDIVIHYHFNKSKAIQLKKEIEAKNRKAIIVSSDLLVQASVNDMMKEVNRHFNIITAFVNSSTIKIPGVKFSDLNWTEMQNHFDINVKSSFQILKAILPSMEAEQYGKIVFLTSQAIETPNANWLHYITAKSALMGFAKALAFEYASKNININIVSPSMTDTDLLADIPQKVKMLTEAKTPVKRLCKPEDVANAISFLLSDDSSFITGETIRVNGGQVML
ncbi:MAG: SDR family oxidoreductase [Bacteroidota bacterium]|nr:SDR family oxidoreductase [Bacteroidota bacterium]